MTIKKSLISVAASAAIIAAVTGCSSDSTNPVNNQNPVTQSNVAARSVNYLH